MGFKDWFKAGQNSVKAEIQVPPETPSVAKSPEEIASAQAIKRQELRDQFAQSRNARSATAPITEQEQTRRDAVRAASQSQAEQRRAIRTDSGIAQQSQEPVVRKDIAAAVSRLPKGSNPSWSRSRRAIEKLPEQLWDGEKVVELLTGFYMGNGLLVLTDKRVLFMYEAILRKVTEDFPFNKITSIEFRSGILLGSIIIHASGNFAGITNVDPKHGKMLVNLARERIGQALL